jgi:hypothetical protein
MRSTIFFTPMPDSKIALAHREHDRSAAVQNFVTCARKQARRQHPAKKFC